MYLFHRIGPRHSSNWNTIDEILALDPSEPISFDGIYTEVWDHAHKLVGRDITLFVMGKYVGDNNAFDHGEKFGRYLTWPKIERFVGITGAKIAYHGWAHRKCVDMTREELLFEMIPPAPLQHITEFAWPHGVCDALARNVARDIGYHQAWCAGPHGDGSQFQRRRSYMNW